MHSNPVLDLPLSDVMRSEIAMSLQMMQLYTVGHFLSAWKNPGNHQRIEQLFDTPQQAHHAAAICAAWIGVRVMVGVDPQLGWWWPHDNGASAPA